MLTAAWQSANGMCSVISRRRSFPLPTVFVLAGGKGFFADKFFATCSLPTATCKAVGKVFTTCFRAFGSRQRREFLTPNFQKRRLARILKLKQLDASTKTKPTSITNFHEQRCTICTLWRLVWPWLCCWCRQHLPMCRKHIHVLCRHPLLLHTCQRLIAERRHEAVWKHMAGAGQPAVRKLE